MLDKRALGTRSIRAQKAPETIARAVLTRSAGDKTDPLETPQWDRRRTDVTVERPRAAAAARSVGAAPRQAAKPLDTELRTKRILGGRTPRLDLPVPTVQPTDPRKTGAVERPVRSVRQPDPIREEPRDRTEPVRTSPPPRSAPVYTPPAEREKPRSIPPRETRPADPPKETPRSVRSDPPKAAPRSDPPPKKSDDSKPSPPPAKREKPID